MMTIETTTTTTKKTGYGACVVDNNDADKNKDGASASASASASPSPSTAKYNNYYLIQQLLLLPFLLLGLITSNIGTSTSTSSKYTNTLIRYNTNVYNTTPNDDSDDDDRHYQSKYKRVQYFGFQIYTGGAPAFLYSNDDDDHDITNNETTTTNNSRTKIPNPECLTINNNNNGHINNHFQTTTAYGEIPVDTDDSDNNDNNNNNSNNNIQCYLGHLDPLQDVKHRLEIMKDGLEKAYTESKASLVRSQLGSDSSNNNNNSNGDDIFKVFVAPEFYFRGSRGAYDFIDDPKRLDRIFGYNHTAHMNTNSNEVEDEEDTEGRELCANEEEGSPVCAILQGLQDIVEDERFQDWFFLFGTVIASQKLPIIDTTTTNATTYDYLYYNFAPVYKGFDPNSSSTTNMIRNNKSKKNKNNTPHYAVGKRFLLPKRYVSTSDFLTPSRDIDWIDRGSDWEELFTSTSNNNNDIDDTRDSDTTSDWVTHDGYSPEQANNVGNTINVNVNVGVDTDKKNDNNVRVISNPRTYEQNRYDDAWFTSYKKQLYDKLGYTMIEYDWLIMDGITMSLEICLDHQLRTALSTYLGDIVTGRATTIPSSTTTATSATMSSLAVVEYVPIPTHQAQLSLVSSAGMSPNTDSLSLAQNGILFLQDGLSNATARRFIDPNLQATCGPETALQYEGGTIAIRRKALLTHTDVRFEYELLSSTLSSNKNTATASSNSTYNTSSTANKKENGKEEVESAHEYKVPVYDNTDEWKMKLDGVFSTKVYEPHLVIYGPIEIAPTTRTSTIV